MAIPAPASHHRDTSPVHLRRLPHLVEEKQSKTPWIACCNNHPATGQDQGRASLSLATHLPVKPYKSTMWHCGGCRLDGRTAQIKEQNPRLRVKPHCSQFGHLPFLLPAPHCDPGLDFVISLAGLGQQSSLVKADTAFHRWLELAT